MPYRSCRCPAISRGLMPRAYIDMILYRTRESDADTWRSAAGRSSTVSSAARRAPTCPSRSSRSCGRSRRAVANYIIAGQVMIHLSVLCAFGRRLLQSVEQATLLKCRAGGSPCQQLVEKMVAYRGCLRRDILGIHFPNCARPHTEFLTGPLMTILHRLAHICLVSWQLRALLLTRLPAQFYAIPTVYSCRQQFTASSNRQ